MSINRQFNKTVNTQRLATVGASHKETWSTNLTNLECAIQPAGSEQSSLGDGAFYKLYKMWCAIDTDLQIGDRIIDDTTTFTVKGVSYHNYGSTENQHVSAFIVMGV